MNGANIKRLVIFYRYWGFAMGDWDPEVVDVFTSVDGQSRTLYLWKADGRVRP